MKKFFILIIAIAAGYLLYNSFFKEEVVEIKDNIIVTQASGMDINAGPSPPPKYAYIQGVIKNIGDKNLSNILIKYSVGYDTLSVVIGYLIAGESAEFRTTSTRVRTGTPQYSIKEIIYNEEENF